jgi:hypothetical protein
MGIMSIRIGACSSFPRSSPLHVLSSEGKLNLFKTFWNPAYAEVMVDAGL